MVTSHWLLFLLLHEYSSIKSYCKVMLDIFCHECDIDLCDIWKLAILSSLDDCCLHINKCFILKQDRQCGAFA